MFIDEEIESNTVIQRILNSLSEMIFIFDDNRKIEFIFFFELF